MSTRNPKPAFHAGAYANIKFSDKWELLLKCCGVAQGADIDMWNLIQTTSLFPLCFDGESLT
jgi:hypothetical protein